MTLYETIFIRRSVRKYEPTALDTAVLTPTGSGKDFTITVEKP